MMVADALRNLLNVADRTEIERSPPDERLDRVQEPFPKLDVARRRAGPDEGRALPRQGGGFIIADHRLHRQRDRRRLGLGSQATESGSASCRERVCQYV